MPKRYPLILMYIGPDVLMPVASAIAAVAGFLLMFWKRTVAFFHGIGQKLGIVKKPPTPE